MEMLLRLVPCCVQACVWDIRRFGPLQYLNMYQTQRTRGRAGASDRSDSRADTPPLAAAGAVARVASAPCGMQGMDNASAHTAHYPDVTNNNPSSDSNNNHNTNNIISEQDALESAWRVVDAHRARSLQGTGMGTGSVPGPSGKRTRDGGLVALRNLPTSRRGGGGGGGGGGGNGGMGSQGWAQGAQGGSSVGGGSGEGPSRASSIPRTLAVGATAPVRPGRTGVLSSHTHVHTHTDTHIRISHWYTNKLAQQLQHARSASFALHD